MDKTTKTLLWVLGGTVAVVVLYYIFFYEGEDGGALGEAEQAVDDTVNAVVRGSKLTNAPYDKSTGVVPGSPDDLASSAGLDVETYSLARAIASEEELASNGTKVAIAWAMKNYANQAGRTITDLLTSTKEPSHDGFYGTQKNIDQSSSGYGGSDRYASSASDPYAGDAEIASQVLSGSVADPTGGATQFDRPKGENAAKVQANRTAEGKVAETVPGADPGLEFWVQKL